MSELLEGMSIYFISPEETNLFHPKEDHNMVSTIKIVQENQQHQGIFNIPLYVILISHVENIPAETI